MVSWTTGKLIATVKIAWPALPARIGHVQCQRLTSGRQSSPAGFEISSEKGAVTTSLPFMVSVTGLLAPTTAPLQPAKMEPLSATAASVTTVPNG